MQGNVSPAGEVRRMPRIKRREQLPTPVVRANPHSAGVRPTVCQQLGSSTVAPHGRRFQSPHRLRSVAGVAGEFDAVSCAVRFGPASGVFRVHTTSRLKFAIYNFELAALRRTLRQCAAGSLMPVWAVMEATAPGVTPEAATTTGLAQRQGICTAPCRRVRADNTLNHLKRSDFKVAQACYLR